MPTSPPFGHPSAGAVPVAEAPGATRVIAHPVISRSREDFGVPGVQVEHTAAEAERLGAFEETAMSEDDAWESNAQLAGPHAPATDGAAATVHGRRERLEGP